MLPVEAHATNFAPRTAARVTATVIPRSLNEPVGFSPQRMTDKAGIDDADDEVDEGNVHGNSTTPALPSPRVTVSDGARSPGQNRSRNRHTPLRSRASAGRVRRALKPSRSEAALALMPGRTEPWRIVDLGVGSGCLLLTLLREFPNARGVGLDASAEALSVAQYNADALGVGARTHLVRGDWRLQGWAGQLGGPFDLLVSNPPYIETEAIDGLMPEVARFEPRLALDGGGDGLAAYRIIADQAAGLVVHGGRVLIEAGEGQVTDISKLLSAAGFAVGGPWKDLGGIDRIVPATH